MSNIPNAPGMPVVPRPADIARYNGWAARYGQPLWELHQLQRLPQKRKQLQKRKREQKIGVALQGDQGPVAAIGESRCQTHPITVKPM